MSKFQPPPTWALPVLVDEKTQKAIFNPVWLKWFVDLSANLSGTGAGSGSISGPAAANVDHIAAWANASGKVLKDGGVLGSAAHAATTDFLAASAASNFLGATARAVDSAKLEGATWKEPLDLGVLTPATVAGTSVRATTVGGFKSSDNSSGISGTFVAGGHTLTFKDGIITGYL